MRTVIALMLVIGLSACGEEEEPSISWRDRPPSGCVYAYEAYKAGTMPQTQMEDICRGFQP